MMFLLVHPNIAQFYGFSQKKGRISVVMEYCMNGDLKNYITKNLCILRIKNKMRMLNEISNVLSFIHGKDIIYRDLKCENILLNDKLNIKLIDFGLSRLVLDSNHSKTSQIGTPYYMAPELSLLGKYYNEKVDVFAFGVIIFEIFSEKFQKIYGEDVENLIKIQFKKANDPNFRLDIDSLNNVPNFNKRIAKTCWNVAPSSRPTFIELINQFKEEYFEKKGLTIYIKKEGESEDFELIDFTMEGLKKAIMEKKYKGGVVKMFNKSIEICNDSDVLNLKQNEVVELKWK